MTKSLAVVGDEPTTPEIDLSVMEQVIALGDLSVLTNAQRLHYYKAVCDSLGITWTTQPFGYIRLNNKLVLYALKNAAEQLRRVHGVSIVSLDFQHAGDLYTVTATARDRTGRTDSDVGVVAVAGLRGDALANATKKAVTQAKRRVTLSICGLGMLDETEADQVPDARIVPHENAVESATIDHEPGELLDERPVSTRITETTMRRLHASMAERYRGDSHEGVKMLAADRLGYAGSLADLSEDDAQRVLAAVLAMPVIAASSRATAEEVRTKTALFNELWLELVRVGVPRSGPMDERRARAEEEMGRRWDQDDPAGMLAALRSRLAADSTQGRLVDDATSDGDTTTDGDAGLDQWTA